MFHVQEIVSDRVRPEDREDLCLTSTAPLRKRATIALARRIGVVLHRMWRDGTEFRFTREEAMAIRTA